MRTGSSPASRAAVVAALLIVALTGCASQAAGPDGATAPDGTTEPGGATEPGGTAEPGSAVEPDTSPDTPVAASCAGIVLEEDEEIDGAALADCVVDGMRAAGSGQSVTVSETTSSRLAWRFDDVYQAYAQVDELTRMVTDGERAWVDFEGTGWVLADSSQPGGTMFQIVEQWLETTGPEVTRSMIAATDWIVGEPEQVELHAGESTELHPVRAVGPFTRGAATIESTTLWMAEPGMLRREDVTAAAFGYATESTAFHFGWGEDVEIPIPES